MNKIRMPVDLAMTILSIMLMGGTYLFPADIVHEILGMALFLLWAVHITLNRRWYGAVFKGKYNPYRVMQTVINCSILVCVVFLMISGIILSNHLFTFLNIQGGLGFARIAHLLASHWYYLFMSLHIGMHVEMIASKIRHSHASTNSHPHASQTCCPDASQPCHSDASQPCHSRAPTRESSATKNTRSIPTKTLVIKILLALVCAYGLYAFITRRLWKYLILQQEFFFFDLERGYILFAIDYISIIILFATLSHLMAKSLKKNR
ncbi:MAG: DUF4405 domain-containing protein [Treponema sp.]|nr:DUF4405 domain-containing protein [Treponema sp.]